MTNEVTHYDFDGAVITCLKVFGASPINKVFLAEYLGGMTVTDIERRVQVPPEDMGQRLLPNNVDVEGAFWDTFDTADKVCRNLHVLSQLSDHKHGIG